MSYDAIRWAMGQPVTPAMTKFLLVAMADCVNAEAGEMVCWPSYAHLARRTGMNTKTVEAGVFRLKQLGYIVDTGKRAGDTGKVIVYRLNDPNTGAVLPGLQIPDANGTRPQNATGNGVIEGSDTSQLIPPNPAANPPKLGRQSPQKVRETPPKQGVGTSKGTRKEPGRGAAVAAIPDVPDQLLSDWLAVRKDKRAKTLTHTAVEGLVREASKAGITVADAVRFCCEAGWVGFNAGWYEDRMGTSRGTGEEPKRRQESFI